jgi:hypothetical protein
MLLPDIKYVAFRDVFIVLRSALNKTDKRNIPSDKNSMSANKKRLLITFIRSLTLEKPPIVQLLKKFPAFYGT